MKYISTRNKEKTFSFKDVFLRGLAHDGGLFVPETMPSYTSHELEKLRNFSYRDLATKIILELHSPIVLTAWLKDFPIECFNFLKASICKLIVSVAVFL